MKLNNIQIIFIIIIILTLTISHILMSNSDTYTYTYEGGTELTLNIDNCSLEWVSTDGSYSTHYCESVRSDANITVYDFGKYQVIYDKLEDEYTYLSFVLE